MRQGRLFVISGPSGAGKGTICSELLKTTDLKLSISMTTRAPRTGEQNGVNYYFVSHEEFQKTIEEGGLLEYAQIYANSYGTPKAPVLKQMAEGHDVLLEIEMQGAMQVKKSYPQANLIFVLPPSLEILKQRLVGRGTETEEQVALRLKTSLEEIKTITDYDYYVVNDDLSRAVEDVKAIISAVHNKVQGDMADIIGRYEEE